MTSTLKFSDREILQTVRMVQMEHLDIRTITLGVSLFDCARTSVAETAQAIYRKLVTAARPLRPAVEEVQERYGVPIVNRRLAVTPIALVAAASPEDDYTPIAQAMDAAAREVGVDYVGGFTALVEKGQTPSDRRLIASLPKALAATTRVCASINLASTRAGINMDAVLELARAVKATAQASSASGGFAAARLVVFANAPHDNPFMAGAFLGPAEADLVINVGVSGPGAVRAALEQLRPGADLGEVADAIKGVAFRITRAGELAGREVSRIMGVRFGILDLSLAPTPAEGDSIADILELIGLERTGAPGSTAALALLNDAVKKGGAMASSYVGGLSGAFIPVSEDAGMARAAGEGILTLEKLEAMTAVCSVGLDMVLVPGDTTVETIAAIMADECAIGVINNKTTAVRLIPVPGKKAGEWVDYGGLWGRAPVMKVNQADPGVFVRRGGRIPAPIQGLTN